jgi:hypothetical protein
VRVRRIDACSSSRALRRSSGDPAGASAARMTRRRASRDVSTGTNS